MSQAHLLVYIPATAAHKQTHGFWQCQLYPTQEWGQAGQMRWHLCLKISRERRLELLAD